MDNESKITFLDLNINDLTYYTLIDDATKAWLNTLHYNWGLWKKSEGVTQMLVDYFGTAPNPYLSVLRILVNVTDFKYIKSKMSLGFTVAEEFSKWILPRKMYYEEFLLPDLKLATFRLLTGQKNLQLTKIVTDAYELPKHKELFLPLIQNMVREKEYKEAAQYASILNLQSHFLNPEVLLLPLILQNKLTIVDELLAGCPEAQKALVTYLDDLLAPSKNMEALLESFIERNQIPEVKMSTMQVRPMNKLVGRLTKLYNLPPELCPNLNQRRGEGALKFLIYKRYVDCTLGGESWNEMARETVGTDSRLQWELVKSLAQANDVKEALRWAREFKIPKDQWPWSLVDCEELEFEGSNTSVEVTAEENWDVEVDSPQYHSLRLSKDCVKIVDDVGSFEEFLNQGLNDVAIVGIDSEWKPSFGTKQSDLALIQIATKRIVYILDVIGMGKEFTELWAELGRKLFDNKEILKLGFGLAHDIAVIKESLPALAGIRATGQGYLDLLHLWRKLTQEHRFQFPHKGDENFTNESLSKLVELCTGRRLDKSDQFSNWERRPLRESQLIYAALDAYCLLEIFEVLRAQSARLDVAFDEVCAETQHVAQKLPKKNPRRHPSKVAPGPTTATEKNSTPKSSSTSEEKPELEKLSADMQAAHEWRVVCDSMLGGLARQLRMCGCDCVYVEFDRRGDQSAKIALRQKRVLLTRGGAFNRFASHVSQSNRYRVLADKPEDQLKEVLSHFNVLVMQRDIFSRCQICNYDEFVCVSRNTIAELGKSFARITRQNGYRFLPGASTDGNNPIRTTNAIVDNNDTDLTFGDDFKLPDEKRGTEGCCDRTWQLSIGTLDILKCATRYRVTVQMDRIPTNVLKNVEQFYICECCGKVYWDGSHMEQALNGILKDIITWQ